MPTRPPRVTKTEAVALRQRRLGEADRIITLLTPGRGKLDVVAKGALRPRSKLAGHLEPMTHTEVVLAHGRNLDIVTQAQTVEGFEELRRDLDRLSTAMYLLELADRFTVEHAEADVVYRLLLTSLQRLARGDGEHLVTRAYELALLDATGFRPELNRCVACGRALGADAAAWSSQAGGVLCDDCLSKHPEAGPIDATVLRVLRAIQAGPYQEAARIRITPELAAGLERTMHDLMRTMSERDLSSATFVSAVRRANAQAAAAGGLEGAERIEGGFGVDPAVYSIDEPEE